MLASHPTADIKHRINNEQKHYIQQSCFYFSFNNHIYFSLNNHIPRRSGERKPILLVLQVCPPVQGLALSLAECQYICFFSDTELIAF